MLPRRPPRAIYPRNQFIIKEKRPPVQKPRQTDGDKVPKQRPTPAPKKLRVKEGESDPKLAGAILELVQGRGAVQIPREFAALHLDFAKAQYNGHMGARKFAQLNLARVKFHNPHLDIKVLRRPWAGKEEQRKYPCTATIYKRTGESETIDMLGKRSMRIYKEIMSRMRAVYVSEEYKTAEKNAQVIAKPYLKWV